MAYLIAQILICLLFTAAIAMILGWLLRGVGTKTQLAAVEDAWRRHTALLDQEHEKLRAHVDELAMHLDLMEAGRARDAEELAALVGQADHDFEQALRSLRAELERLRDAAVLERARTKALERALESREELMATLRSAEAQRQRELALGPDDAAGAASAAIPVEPAQDAELQQALQRTGQRLDALESLLERMHELAQHTASRSTSRRKRTPEGTPPAELMQDPPQQPDSLQAITGIGPVLERTLNGLGIYKFRQIARLTPQNIEWVAAHIDWFPQRILRDDWVQQAQRLHRQTHPDEQL